MKNQKVKHKFKMTSHANEVTVKELSIPVSESDKVALDIMNTRLYKKVAVSLIK